MAGFDTEREGQIAFYETFLQRVDPTLELDDIIGDRNDGVLNGNILEFKLVVSDLNKTLFQAVKYLSHRRNEGKPVTANILLVSLNTGTAYLYKSADYLDDIEKVYYGAASKYNSGFSAKRYDEKLEYAKNQADAQRLVEILRSKNWTRTHIDENCIVGWAEHYYRAVPGSRKEDFIGDNTGVHQSTGEIRNPTVFKDYLYPYEGASNVKFQYLMDRLNDFLHKKDLGAFYTPEPYVKKAQELLREAIARVPEGNDYVIIDRCAGTGNLEKGLTDEELSHCVLSTVEYYEYKVMLELLGSKVYAVIPPVEADDTFLAGMVRGADALTKDYIENPIIKKFLDDPKCTVILYENPPYAETTSVEHQRRNAGTASSGWKSSWVVTQMKEAIRSDPTIPHTATNDMGNAFIWSGFEYYLRQPTDSYIVFSPIKYWKAQNLVKKRVVDGFAGDRHHFHASSHTCVTVILWSNEDDDGTERFELPGFDIDADDDLVDAGMLDFPKIHSRYSEKYYDKRRMPDDVETDVVLGYNGEPAETQRRSLRPIWNDDIIGYMVIDSYGFDNPDLMSVLIRAGLYKGHGFYLRSDNFLEKLPMFAASRYVHYFTSWTGRGRIMKTADGCDRFEADVASGRLSRMLLQTLLFTCVEPQNHMRSFTGSDGRFYRNELTLDDSNGPTLATEKLSELEPGWNEMRIIDAWNDVLSNAKLTSNYDSSLTYGLFQITNDLNTYDEVHEGRTKRKIYHYPELNGSIETLKALIKPYYLETIMPFLFEYEFLK